MKNENVTGTFFEHEPGQSAYSRYIRPIAQLAMSGMMLAFTYIGFVTVLDQFMANSSFTYGITLLVFLLHFDYRAKFYKVESQVRLLPFSLKTLPLKLIPVAAALLLIMAHIYY